MAGILELLGWEFKITVINILRALMSNAGSMQELMDNVSREMESLRKNKEEMLEIKNTNQNDECF